MQMTEAASILKKIKDGAEGQGYSMDKIKDSVGELHVDLANAAERYLPSGEVILKYGEALAEVESTIRDIVNDCTQLWITYIQAYGDDATASDESSIPEGETLEQMIAREDAAGELARAKDAAFQKFYARSADYDHPYDTWEEAYEAAVSGLRDVNDDGVTDSWWDDQLPWIDNALTILTWVGIALAVVCLFVAGPVLAVVAAVAAVIALASLVLTIVKVANGRGDGSDIAWAVVGVIPFGRVGSLFKGGQKAGPFIKGFLGDMTGFSGLTQLRTLQDAKNLPALFRRFPPTNSAGELVGSNAIVNKIKGLSNEIADVSRFKLSNPLDQILGGTSGSLNARMADAFSGYGTNIGNHIRTYVSGSGGDLIPSGLEQVGNVVDMVMKPAHDTFDEIGEVIDKMQPTNESIWQEQMGTTS
ncbi:MAG: hypothetical protein ACOH19_09990 [Rhodoglobus sp.]